MKHDAVALNASTRAAAAFYPRLSFISAYMFLPRITLANLLLVSPLACFAQTPDAAPVPRFYVGLGAYSSYYQPIGKSEFYQSNFRLPVQFTSGYQISPRVAVQLGVATATALSVTTKILSF